VHVFPNLTSVGENNWSMRVFALEAFSGTIEDPTGKVFQECRVRRACRPHWLMLCSPPVSLAPMQSMSSGARRVRTKPIRLHGELAGRET